MTSLGMERSAGPMVSPSRLFLCPSCRHPGVSPRLDGPHVATCDRCGWATDNLLDLIPVRSGNLAEVVLGPGARGLLRVAIFVAVVAGVVALVVMRP